MIVLKIKSVIFYAVLIISVTSLVHAETKFLDQTKTVGSQYDWSREIVSRKGGAVKFEINSQGPVSIILIADRSYRALISGNQRGLRRSDVILNIPRASKNYKKTVKVPPGSSWFIIQNLSRKTAKIRLRCYGS